MRARLFVCRTPGCKNEGHPGPINQSDYYDTASWPAVVCVCGAECDYLEYVGVPA